MKTTQTVGIDDMALYVPSIYFDIKDLAEARGIEYAKLNKGLGLTHMALPDAHEDAATMAANAVAELIDKNNLNPTTIGRIYLGTESALDGAKPTATYVMGMLEQRYAAEYGKNCFNHCDVIDMTFACVGGVDAMHNTIDWASKSKDRIGIVVTSDNAKYELASTGEYTQGAGAIALLIKQNPRLLAIHDIWGVGTKSVHDFFKPKRRATKEQIIHEVFELIAHKNGSLKYLIEKLEASLEVNGILDTNDVELSLHKDTPVFDGQYSNQCYQDRIGEAFEHYRKQAKIANDTALIDSWQRLVFHLPYAFHGKRIFSEIYMWEQKRKGTWEAMEAQLDIKEPKQEEFDEEAAYLKAKGKFLRGITKTAEYRAFVTEKMEKGQRASSLVGNMYACSIFLSLMSTLEVDAVENQNLTGKDIGLIGYGSGSKSKVFSGTLQPQWKEVANSFKIFEKMKQRSPIDYATYENLHKGAKKDSSLVPNHEFALAHIETEKGVREGARSYEWMA